ncbi:hypothetical protein F5B19DRAFT_504524 [Rostrohypoxylon terebratum]|nr:hypothetical protein F5B19DRAFT_504524 [Rostrohypoxylon terebratum]
MSIPSGDLFIDRFFKFIVGPNKKEFLVHADVFARLSGPLNALINGKFTEAERGYTTWDDVAEGTFKRFAQFAYSGDYDSIKPKHSSEPEIEEKATSVGIDPQVAQAGSISPPFLQLNLSPGVGPKQDDGYRWVLPYSIHDMYRDKKKNQTISITRLRLRLSKKGYREFSNHDGRVATVDALMKWYGEIGLANDSFNNEIKKDDLGTKTCENIREIIFCHAELYVLADKYLVNELARVATIKMGKLLHTLQWTQNMIRHIANLIPYVYENTMPGDMMREALVWYVSIVADDLYEDDFFSKVFKDIPEFAYGVLRKLIKYRVIKD